MPRKRKSCRHSVSVSACFGVRENKCIWKAISRASGFSFETKHNGISWLRGAAKRTNQITTNAKLAAKQVFAFRRQEATTTEDVTRNRIDSKSKQATEFDR